jgi:hypothetical protein
LKIAALPANMNQKTNEWRTHKNMHTQKARDVKSKISKSGMSAFKYVLESIKTMLAQDHFDS